MASLVLRVDCIIISNVEEVFDFLNTTTWGEKRRDE
jgi:hypothetical protein